LSKKLDATEVSWISYNLITLGYFNSILIALYCGRKLWTTQATYSLQQKKIWNKHNIIWGRKTS
jgi:hypothetical protein